MALLGVEHTTVRNGGHGVMLAGGAILAGRARDGDDGANGGDDARRGREPARRHEVAKGVAVGRAPRVSWTTAATTLRWRRAVWGLGRSPRRRRSGSSGLEDRSRPRGVAAAALRIRAPGWAGECGGFASAGLRARHGRSRSQLAARRDRPYFFILS